MSTKVPSSFPSLPYEPGYNTNCSSLEVIHGSFCVVPHVCATFDTAVETNSCTGHVIFLHAEDPFVNEKVEVGHGEHGVLPIDPLNSPIAQAVHDCALIPPNPTLHTQPVAPDTEFEFDGQSEHMPFPEAALNFLATHDWH